MSWSKTAMIQIARWGGDLHSIKGDNLLKKS